METQLNELVGKIVHVWHDRGDIEGTLGRYHDTFKVVNDNGRFRFHLEDIREIHNNYITLNV